MDQKTLELYVKNVERERDELKADNEKLRKELQGWKDYGIETYQYWKEWYEQQ